MKRILTIRHWQLFILIIGIPVVFQIAGIMGLLSRHFPNVIFGFVPIMLLYIVVFFSWYYAVGTNLNKKLPPTVNMKLKRFRVFLFITYIYFLIFCLLISGMMSGIFDNTGNTGLSKQTIFAIVFPVLLLHLFSMFCIFYCLYFISKSLKAVELQRPITFNDYAGDFFLIWFFPIGIWFIQPRINKPFDETLQATEQN